MKEILSITELAKLRNVSTETLRHYDRIGLLKPHTIDEKTRERYYSIYQYEQLGTIKELKQLGFSLKQIKEYLDDRNIQTTQTLLAKSLNIVQTKIAEYKNIESSLQAKLAFLERLKELHLNSQVTIKDISQDRYYLMSNDKITDTIKLSYAALKLETKINNLEPYSPIFASNRYIGLYPDIQAINEAPYLGLQVEDPELPEVKKIPKGSYATLMYQGDFFENRPAVAKLLEHCKTHKIALTGEILQVQWSDLTFVNDSAQLIYELQIRLK